MRGLRRRSGVRQRGGRDCIQAREPRQPDPSSPPTPSTTLASCWKTNRWIRCLSFLRRSVVEKDTQNLWLLITRNQLLEDGWVALLPCPPTIFSRSAAQCRCTLTLVATLLYPELWRFQCKICPWCQITRGHSDTSSHVSISGGRKDTTRRKNYGKLNARLPRRSPARQPLHGRWIQLEHCWTLRLPDMLEGLEHLAWGQTR